MPVEYENRLILVEKRDSRVAVVTLNNPPMNLNSIPSMTELGEAFRKLDGDPDALAIVLTGSGTKAFNVGSDLTGFKAMHGNFKGRKFKMETDMMNSIEFVSKPTICAIEGYCMGGGLELACCCDIRIVAENAVFAQPEINLGLYPASGGLYRLPRIIGYPQALEMMYLGESINAAEAYRLGLANKVVPSGTAVGKALEMAEKIAGKAPNAIRVIKEGSRKMWLKDSKDNHYTNLEYIEGIFNHYNGMEGVDAFLEKRAPAFRYNPETDG
ncbi:MAG: enoyl-CoA hydratase/isomerase family protein [Desulfovibrio sp.]|jgi:enoyl-CoA hydratase/carnithine racemase|nr:enoyl-CoA hydratase/isomerase family protein [Desulfovibrio sp.]